MPSRSRTQLLAGSDEDETAWRNGEWYTARLSLSPLRPEERRTTVVDHERDGMRLQIRTPGDLESIELAAFDRVPPGPGEIEVSVTASSLNFADVLVAFGRYPSFEGQLPQLGTDFAGVVTAVGPDVTEHQVGDHVGGMSPNGCWGTFVTCDAALAVKLPPGCPTSRRPRCPPRTPPPGTACTTWPGSQSGDKVLIHSATGGVGQAAIAIARAAGAEIFATAGSRERRELLRDMGIEHVYDSRSTDFADQIRKDTDGYGVDIVLNSLPGAAQRAGLELLAFGGRFVEIGKRDIYGDTRMGLFPFRRNLSFYAVDLGLLTVTHPDKRSRAAEHGVRTDRRRHAAAAGEHALPAQRRSDRDPRDGRRRAHRQAGARRPAHRQSQVVVPPEQAQVFRPDGAYIITGGLGGLGLFLAEKMAAAGCGRIVLNVRSQPNAEAQEIIERIRATGADVEVDCGDIAEARNGRAAGGRCDRHRASAARRAARGGGGRGRHARQHHRRAPRPRLGAEGLRRVEPALRHDTISRWTGSARSPRRPRWSVRPGRARTPRPTAGWTPSPIGAGRRAFPPPPSRGGRGPRSAAPRRWPRTPTARSRPTTVRMRSRRCCATTARTPAMRRSMGTPWLTAFAQRSKFAEAFKSLGKSRTGTSEFLAELDALPREEWPTRLRRLVSEQISLILRRSIDPDRPLSEYGLDSLGSLELRTRIETETGIRITSTDITTVRGLADHLCEQLAPTEAAVATT